MAKIHIIYFQTADDNESTFGGIEWSTRPITDDQVYEYAAGDFDMEVRHYVSEVPDYELTFAEQDRITDYLDYAMWTGDYPKGQVQFERREVLAGEVYPGGEARRVQRLRKSIDTRYKP